MDNREKLLLAAGRIYAEAGFRGATTRRIADEAGVNEVTLFRLFGSKAQLIAEALSCHDPMGTVTLPLEPSDPVRELTAWCDGHAEALSEMRGMIRKTMADLEEHPEMAPYFCKGQTPHFQELVSYTTRLLAHYPEARADDVQTSCTMLFSALFADGMTRELVPGVFPHPARETNARYVRVFLRGLGIDPSAPPLTPAPAGAALQPAGD
jgi:AcrR family transcriptional regulator